MAILKGRNNEGPSCQVPSLLSDNWQLHNVDFLYFDKLVKTEALKISKILQNLQIKNSLPTTVTFI